MKFIKQKHVMQRLQDVHAEAYVFMKAWLKQVLRSILKLIKNNVIPTSQNVNAEALVFQKA